MTLAAPHQSAAIHYTLEIIEADGSARLAQPRKKNLILDAGLDSIGTYSRRWYDVCYRCVCGTGTTPTKRDSGAVTFTRAAATVTASAGFFEAEDVGRLLKFDSGAEMYITGFTSATAVTVSASGTLAASEGTVWYVNQTALAAEIANVRTDNEGRPISSTYAAGTLTNTWRATFPVVGGVTVIREIGWISSSNETPDILFGRDLLAGAGVTLVAGQQLRVTIELQVQIGPLTAQPYANVVTGWTANGQQMLISSATDAGAADTVYRKGPLFETVLVGTDSGALAYVSDTPPEPAGLLSAAYVSPQGYTAGTFRQVRRAVFGPDAFDSAAIRSLYVGNTTNSALFRVRLDAAEAKTATQSLTLDFVASWGRTLVN